MKLKVETTSAGKRISWFNDIGVCIATAGSGMCEIAGYAHPRIRDAAQAAARELWDNPHADLRHYEGMTLPEDPAEVWPIGEWTKPADRACDYDTGVCACDRRSTCRAPRDTP